MTSADPLVVAGRPVDRERVADICRRFGVAELAVFGSVARGEATPASDIDMLYVLRAGTSLGFAFNDLEDELSALVGRRVDLVAKRALNEAIRERVLSEARAIFP